MKRLADYIWIYVFGLFMIALACPSGWAIPVLQVDINGGVYNGVDPNGVLNESTLTDLASFTVDALFTPGGNVHVPADTYYLVIGFSDLDGNAVSDIGGGQVLVNGNPLTGLLTGTPSGLPPYGPYPTLYGLVEFNFDNATAINTYNVQDDPGDPVPNVDGDSLLVEFLIDRSGLSDDYLIAFDLYGGGKFAPPSHNGASGSMIPEPATMGLIGLGMLGFAISRKRRISG